MFYIFHGDDAFSQKETLESLKKKLGDPEMLSLNTTVFESGQTRANHIIDACNAMPFLAPKRLVIVYNFFSGKGDKDERAALLDYLPTIPDSARLVFMEKGALEDRSKAIKCARSSENGYEKRFNRPQGRVLERWILDAVDRLGGRIHPDAARRLAMNVGSDLQILENEITKLVLYKGISAEPELITIRDVEKLSPYAAEANIFDLVDALGNRNGKRAALLLQQKLDEGSEPFQIFSMFIRQFRLIIQVKELVEEGNKPPEIAKLIKQHPFVVGKIANQARSFDLPQLEKIYGHLLETDMQVKTGRTDLVTALNLLIFNLA
ncbi:MAG: DNA polymerase III subunit delta [Ardenticatenaceae bacterium]|nr:DNA polymerase III subunit delta [Ardenticatenaceae bacterium]